MSLRAKDHLEGTKVAVSPRYCAEQKVQTGSAAAGGHRRVATRETTGDLATRRGAGDPETRAEWMKVLRYDHLRSAPVVVGAGYARSGNRLHSLQRRSSPSAGLGAFSMACRFSGDAHTRPLFVAVVPVPNFASGADKGDLLPLRAVQGTAPNYRVVTNCTLSCSRRGAR